jgi:aryl-alcohol dehydrogenase-like predicted oxidoreductase
MNADTPPAGRLALGTAQFGLPYGIANQTGKIEISEAQAMISIARASGIDTLDTAIAYGESEQAIGQCNAHGFRIISKLPALPPNTKDIDGWITEQINSSLAKLKVNRLYGFLIHRPENLFSCQGQKLYEALQQAKAEGKIEKIGVSIYNPSELEKLISSFTFDLVQAPFSLVDRRLSESGWLKKLKELGIEIHARSVFLQGLLLMSRDSIPVRFKKWDSLWDRWHDWLARNPQFTQVQVCLGFPLAHVEIDRIVVGADHPDHLMQIINSANAPTPSRYPAIVSGDKILINPSEWSKL